MIFLSCPVWHLVSYEQVNCVFSDSLLNVAGVLQGGCFSSSGGGSFFFCHAASRSCYCRFFAKIPLHSVACASRVVVRLALAFLVSALIRSHPFVAPLPLQHRCRLKKSVSGSWGQWVLQQVRRFANVAFRRLSVAPDRVLK